jgi:hypothetical protein
MIPARLAYETCPRTGAPAAMGRPTGFEPVLRGPHPRVLAADTTASMVEKLGIEPSRHAVRGRSGAMPVIPMVDEEGLEPSSFGV